MKHLIKNLQQRATGFIEDGIYYTIRDYSKGQLLRIYGNAIGIDDYILYQLRKNNIKIIKVTIENLEKKPFDVYINLDIFIQLSQRIEYKGLNGTPQRILSIEEFKRCDEETQAPLLYY